MATGSSIRRAGLPVTEVARSRPVRCRRPAQDLRPLIDGHADASTPRTGFTATSCLARWIASKRCWMRPISKLVGLAKASPVVRHEHGTGISRVGKDRRGGSRGCIVPKLDPDVGVELLNCSPGRDQPACVSPALVVAGCHGVPTVSAILKARAEQRPAGAVSVPPREGPCAAK